MPSDLATLSSLALLIVAVGGIGVRSSVLVTTGSFVLVYLVGTAAAIKLLPRRTWARSAAIVAFISTLGLMAITGLYMLWPLVVAACALIYSRHRTRMLETIDADVALATVTTDAVVTTDSVS